MEKQTTPKLSAEMISKIELCYDLYSDLPDGAWWAACAEQGVEPEDLVTYWEEKKAKTQRRS
jgi:hypothetical protein